MRIEALTKQAEELVFDIGRQASYRELHAAALSLLKELYNFERQHRPSAHSSSEAATADNESAHVEKAERKLLKWATDQNSVPAQILVDYLFQKNAGVVTKSILEEAFKVQAHGDVAKFSRNFDQMKNFNEKNHAKIFDVSPIGVITIWPPIEKQVKDFELAVFKGKKQGLVYSHRHSGELAED